MNRIKPNPTLGLVPALVAALACTGRSLRTAGAAALAVAAVTLPTAHARAHGNDDPEVVVEWNELLQRNIPSTVSLGSFRYYAMLHIAMFDAVNSVEGDYEPYHVRVPAPRSASAEAAAAQAARDVLVALIPTAQPTFDEALQNRLRTIDTWSAVSGVAVGARVARSVVDWRTGDGWELPNPAYTPPAIPGLWQPAATGQIAALVNASQIRPFGLLTPTQYLPAPPPLLNSARYAEDFNDVKALGAVDSNVRTADQTLVARLFAGPPNYSPNPFALWSQVTRIAARSHGLSLIDSARLFALTSVAMHDGLQTAHTSKYIYGLWRPVTAIRRADEDFNTQTTADPAWTPLLGTPPYPSHASNLTCIAASAARALERSLRTDSMVFSVNWTGLAGNANVTRTYASFSQMVEEAGLSRVYGGIHFLFEIDAAQSSCTRVADFIANNHMRRRRR
jgi:hypothetical protein